MDAGISRSNKTQGQKSDAQPDDKSRLSNTAGKNGTSHGVGYGSDSDRQESITRSGINTRNLQITDEAGQIRQTGLTAEETRAQVSTGTTTESARADAGSLHNRFDKEQVQRELDTQTEVTQTFSHTRQQIWSAAATKAQAHREEAENLTRSADVAEKNGDHATAAQLRKEAESERQQAKRWQWAGVAVNMVGAGLSAPTQSSAGIAANAAAPAASYVIGQEFKRRNAEGSLGHLLAHATLGGLTAAAGGNDPLAGALSSGGAEAAAGYISGLFGQTDGSRLSAEQKETVTAITGLIGTAAGAALGSTPADVAQGSLNAKNAVENNYYAGQQNFAVEQACNRRTPEQCREIQQAYSEARLLMGEKLLPVIDEAARFFIPPYDLVRSLAEAKNGREAIIAIVSALPPAKIFDRAKDLIHAGKELDALKELQRLKEYFSANPALATANGVKVPSTHVKPQSAPSSGGSSAHSTNLINQEVPKLSIQQYYQHHKSMVEDIKEQLRKQGYSVSSREVSFKNGMALGRTRPDIIARSPDGKIVIYEIKTGNATLSIRQSEIYPQIRDGNAIPVGEVARRFGLKPGIPLKNQGYPNGIPIIEKQFPGIR